MSENLNHFDAASLFPAPLAEGVHFRCTDCGFCCSGAPGKVRISEEEQESITGFLGEDMESFLRKWTRDQDGERLLKEKTNGDCVFFEHNRCRIHPVKPRQCRTYPFWFRNVRSEEAWAKTCRECPGIGEGEFFPPGRILEIVQEEIAGGIPPREG
ncbi:MAG: YkgJ family cysteine cluster protein [Kiritimatiellia bacterium]